MAIVDHTQATELFSAYWDEELGKEQIDELEAHLKSCLVCRREYQTFERTVGAVGSLHRMVAPGDFTAGVRDKIRKRSKGRFFTPRRLAERVPYEMFSLVMLGLLLAIYIALSFGEPSHLKLP